MYFLFILPVYKTNASNKLSCEWENASIHGAHLKVDRLHQFVLWAESLKQSSFILLSWLSSLRSSMALGDAVCWLALLSLSVTGDLQCGLFLLLGQPDWCRMAYFFSILQGWIICSCLYSLAWSLLLSALQCGSMQSTSIAFQLLLSLMEICLIECYRCPC